MAPPMPPILFLTDRSLQFVACYKSPFLFLQTANVQQLSAAQTANAIHPATAPLRRPLAAAATRAQPPKSSGKAAEMCYSNMY